MRFAVVLLVAMSISAGVAQANQRFAASGGSGPSPCLKTAPCSLKVAIEEAASGDEVIVGAGTYSLGTTTIGAPMTVTDLNIHGDPAGPMPKITASSSASTFSFGGTGMHISYLEFDNESSAVPRGITCDREGVLERVRAIAVGPEALGVFQISDCLVRDSVILAEGTEAAALGASGTAETGTVRNVTAIATGAGSKGIRSKYSGPAMLSPYTLDVANTIARGASSDLQAEEFMSGSGKIVVSHSNFVSAKGVGEATITDAGGNQTAPPLFVDGAAGDYREAAGSPTIDAGITDRVGPLDLGGNPRSLGSAPDIGAFEFVPAGAPAGRGGVRSLKIVPRRFRASRSGGPVVSRTGKGGRPPVGGRVTFTLTGDADVTFSVSRTIRGRLAGGHCRRKSPSNRGHKKCTFNVPVKGGFTRSGGAGENRFVFSGRIGGSALRPGAYKLTALAGHLVSAPFEIAAPRP
jgi:hypothetical protein